MRRRVDREPIDTQWGIRLACTKVTHFRVFRKGVPGIAALNLNQGYGFCSVFWRIQGHPEAKMTELGAWVVLAERNHALGDCQNDEGAAKVEDYDALRQGAWLWTLIPPPYTAVWMRSASIFTLRIGAGALACQRVIRDLQHGPMGWVYGDLRPPSVGPLCRTRILFKTRRLLGYLPAFVRRHTAAPQVAPMVLATRSQAVLV